MSHPARGALPRRRLESVHESLLHRIERFFGLAAAGRTNDGKGGTHA